MVRAWYEMYSTLRSSLNVAVTMRLACCPLCRRLWAAHVKTRRHCTTRHSLLTSDRPCQTAMERLGRATARAGVRQPSLPAVRVVGFTIPATRAARQVHRNSTRLFSAAGAVAASPLASPASLRPPLPLISCRAVPLRPQAAAQQAADPQAGGGAAAASGPRAGAAAAGSSSSASGAGPTFHLACPICQTTELQLQNAGGQPTGDLCCPRCARTFAANAT